MSATETEQAETTAVAPSSGEGSMRMIGHLPGNAELTVALCGARIFGIPAFGPRDNCVVCDELAGLRA